MSRVTDIIQDDSHDVTSAGGSENKDIVTVASSGAGEVVSLLIKATTNVSDMDYFSIWIDGVEKPIVIDVPFFNELGIKVTNDNGLLIIDRAINYNSSFKVSAYFNAASTINFKYFILADVED